MFKQRLPDHLGHVGCRNFDITIPPDGGDRGCIGFIKFRPGNHVFLEHVFKPGLPAADRTLWIGQRIAAGRARQQGHHHCRFSQSQFTDFLAVVNESGCSDSVGAGTEVNRVQIESQYFFLAQFALNLQSKGYFLEFAQVYIVAVKRQVIGQLHRDGAATPETLTGHKSVESPHQALKIDAGVGVKAHIFSGDQRIDQALGDILVVDRVAAIAYFVYQLTIGSINSERRFELHITVGFRFRQQRGQIQIGCHGDHRSATEGRGCQQGKP